MAVNLSKISHLIQWYQTGRPHPDEAILCATRDVFQARIESFFKEICASIGPQEASLLTAAIGEIGNNSFDHNLGKWQDDTGSLFFRGANYCVIIDRGQGIHASLEAAGIRLANDDDYIRTAFTQKISGRSPEMRGNGLKLVASIVHRLHLSLYLRSGNGKISYGDLAFDQLDKLLEKRPNPGVFCTIDWSKSGEN